MKKQKTSPVERKIVELRCKDLNQVITIKGQLIQASDIRPQAVSAKFECLTCGTIISILQIERIFREPSKCTCGREGKFKLLGREMIDCQRIIIGQGKKDYDKEYGCKIESDRLAAFLQEDLCDPKYKIFDKIGKSIEVTGILKEIPVQLENGGISTRFDWAIEAQSIKFK